MAGTIAVPRQLGRRAHARSSTALHEGAHEGVVRNAALRTLAAENRAGLDASAESLGSARRGRATRAPTRSRRWATASEEIRSFVTLVRKLARQSKLLALNAAMEAARAGEHGEGFAVVASEVRRLSAMSSEAAERTEAIVKGVLRGHRSVARVGEARGRRGHRSARGHGARRRRRSREIERAVAARRRGRAIGGADVHGHDARWWPR